MVAMVAVVIRVMQDEELRERLGEDYYIPSLAIFGTVLLVLSGNVWDRGVMQRLKSLRSTAAVV
jgi:hypothetical protein